MAGVDELGRRRRDVRRGLAGARPHWGIERARRRDADRGRRVSLSVGTVSDAVMIAVDLIAMAAMIAWSVRLHRASRARIRELRKRTTRRSRGNDRATRCHCHQPSFVPSSSESMRRATAVLTASLACGLALAAQSPAQRPEMRELTDAFPGNPKVDQFALSADGQRTYL